MKAVTWTVCPKPYILYKIVETNRQATDSSDLNNNNNDNNNVLLVASKDYKHAGKSPQNHFQNLVLQ